MILRRSDTEAVIVLIIVYCKQCLSIAFRQNKGWKWKATVECGDKVVLAVGWGVRRRERGDASFSMGQVGT